MLYEFELITPFGNFTTIKNERFVEVVETINAAITGNNKVLEIVYNSEVFKDMKEVIVMVQKSGGKMSVGSITQVVL